MKVSIDVYTKNIDAALNAFKFAIESGATSARLISNENYETRKFEYLNLVFEVDHKSEAISMLDNGLFVRDVNEIGNR